MTQLIVLVCMYMLVSIGIGLWAAAYAIPPIMHWQGVLFRWLW